MPAVIAAARGTGRTRKRGGVWMRNPHPPARTDIVQSGAFHVVGLLPGGMGSNRRETASSQQKRRFQSVIDIVRVPLPRAHGEGEQSCK